MNKINSAEAHKVFSVNSSVTGWTNPHWIIEAYTQHPQKLNVWAGIVANRIIGPFFFEETLTGERYLEFLQNDLVPALAAAGFCHSFSASSARSGTKGASWLVAGRGRARRRRENDRLKPTITALLIFVINDVALSSRLESQWRAFGFLLARPNGQRSSEMGVGDHLPRHKKRTANRR
ncbi:hypothetical protein NQ318_007392 [Aromia moschata]|uniref:Uncharacterized protein n=1 Tax=Aromia moschata TaxID=1265417 RepID=A0AAV8YF32_9CUCU|nr:hypothetical protein NQ318_007392 [Aromia moschata]